ncbi:fimbrial protein [Yersinia intermedia]|uniref:fimbrial protein n=1 Tax=Yersinia intermedia TaxID=631 RepID=UPI0005DDEB43|nr:fimbrial protein [Yersinia intermedia]MDA5512864.1 fimbrial protein [Yersinia intermedia]CNI73511.1 P pilus assembly protein%2C pilin FimA [Yersinia intermedia]
MARCNKASRCVKALAACLLITLFPQKDTFAADTTTVEFSAQISDGSCELTLSETALSYGIYRMTDAQAASTAGLLPLTATIQCSGATIPTLSVSGTAYTSASVPQAVIFRDADSVASGVGFMVRRDTGGITLGNFYDTGAALVNGTPVTLPAVAEQAVYNAPLLLGLVHAGSEPVTPGTVKASLTFKVTYE